MREYVEFEISSSEAYLKLEAVTSAFATAKCTDDWKDEAFWLRYFDTVARAHFWWPSLNEIEEWRQRWFSTPVDRRFTDPSLKNPWTFASMIDALKNGDYKLLGCHKVSESIGRFEFDPQAWPYGGTGCMKALIEAFGHRVVYEPRM